jgi:cardiolipin synthase
MNMRTHDLAGKKSKRSKRSQAMHKKDDYFLRNRVRLVHGGKEFFELLKQLIDNAHHSIHIQTYIFDEDKTGTFIADALIAAAKRKVAVYLLADGFASQKLSKSFREKLQQSGIHFRFFEPLLRSHHFYFGRRLHHKVIVIDGVQALVGSMNIADRYNDLPGERAWFDLALYVEGEAGIALHNICCMFWAKRKSKAFKLPDNVHEFIASIPEKEYCPIRVRQNDWVSRKSQISKTYSGLFRGAKETISIVCSYFLPGKTFLKQLKQAVKKGVEVKVVLAGFSDVKIAKSAERYLYRWMLRNKIQVYEYQPTVLHAKMAFADNHLLTLGSFNINGLSSYASVELNLDIKNEAFVKKIQKETEAVIEKDCKVIDLTTYTIRLFSLQQFLQWASFQIIRFMLTLSTFYFRQRE